MSDEPQPTDGVAAPTDVESADVAFPAPPPAKDGYLRVAVVQLAFHPAAAIGRVHLLQQPPLSPDSQSWPNWFETDLSNAMRNVRACQKRIGKKLRSIYVDHQSRRLVEIIRTCAAWDIQVLVFPEYSVPPECLEHVVPATKGMTVVLGTHSVEAHRVDSGFYAQFGIAAPVPGTSVAPVAIDGVIKHFQPKLNRNHLEDGMSDGESWDPVDLPSAQKMGILICLDFLKREALQYRTHVAPKIDDCKIIAVPALTPKYTTDRFDAKALDESVGYGRSALFADNAAGGGSSIAVASALARPSGVFPYGIPSLAVGEEGIVAVDIDVDYSRTAEKVQRSYSDRTAVIPVAASAFRYRTVQKDADHIKALSRMFQGVDLTCRASVARVLEQNEEAIAGLADKCSPTAASTINDVLENRDQARSAEELLCRLRHVELSDDIYPLQGVDQLRVRAAVDEAEAFEPSRAEEEAAVRLRRRLRELSEEVG
jgi:predicted amidohydrolase